MVWNIGPVNEYEAQSAIIPFVGTIIRKNIRCEHNVISFLLVGVLRQRKKEIKLILADDKMCCL
jgi:hypothetical protein